MTTKLDVVNSYSVQFVFDYTVITTTIFAMHEEAAIAMAADYICDDLGIHPSVMERVQDVVVDMIDEDVL